MAIGFDFRNELYGPWPVAQGHLIEQFDRLFAALSLQNPLFDLTAAPVKSAVLATDSFGALMWISQTQAIGASVTSLNGDTTAAQTVNAVNGVTVANVGPVHTIGLTTPQPTTGYNAVDGSAGISTTITTGSLVGKTVTIKNGLITGFA